MLLCGLVRSCLINIREIESSTHLSSGQLFLHHSDTFFLLYDRILSLFDVQSNVNVQIDEENKANCQNNNAKDLSGWIECVTQLVIEICADEDDEGENNQENGVAQRCDGGKVFSVLNCRFVIQLATL